MNDDELKIGNPVIVGDLPPRHSPRISGAVLEYRESPDELWQEAEFVAKPPEVAQPVEQHIYPAKPSWIERAMAYARLRSP